MITNIVLKQICVLILVTLIKISIKAITENKKYISSKESSKKTLNIKKVTGTTNWKINLKFFKFSKQKTVTKTTKDDKNETF